MGLSLYFIGAGLTKSLERTRRVPLMADFVHVLADYVDNKVVLDTLVGMEVGRAYETACDECLELATALRRRGEVTDEERGRFAALVRGRPSESIEAIFERVESMSPETPGFEIASGLHPTYFRYAINQVFSTIEWDLQLDLLTRFLTRQFENAQNAHVFVSFNYDLALDRAVEIASEGMWQPRDGYGFEFPFFTVDERNARCTAELPTGTPGIRILKPHGSLNWLRRRRNRTQQSDGGIDGHYMTIPLDSNWKLQYWPSSETFHHISFPDDWLPRDVEILIAPPSPTKPSIVPPVCSAEFDAVSTADEVFVIGYSFPKTDKDQWDLIHEARKKSATAISTLTIINHMTPQALPDYIENIRGLFQPRSIRVFNDGFAKFSARNNAFESALGA